MSVCLFVANVLLTDWHLGFVARCCLRVRVTVSDRVKVMLGDRYFGISSLASHCVVRMCQCCLRVCRLLLSVLLCDKCSRQTSIRV